MNYNMLLVEPGSNIEPNILIVVITENSKHYNNVLYPITDV